MVRALRPTSSNGPRSAHLLVVDAFRLYRRYPLLFLVLAAAVIVPYEALVLVATGLGPFEQGSLDFVVSLWLTLTDLALVTPLVSALHVHAVREVREGGDPKLIPIARQGLKVLPVVAAVSIVSWLGILAGFVALIAPGIYLTLRWLVVAQSAAIDDEGWLTALRRGGDLAEGHYGHVFVFFIYVSLITPCPSSWLGCSLAATPRRSVLSRGRVGPGRRLLLRCPGHGAALLRSPRSAGSHGSVGARGKWSCRAGPAVYRAVAGPRGLRGGGSTEGLVRRSGGTQPHALLGRGRSTSLEYRHHPHAAQDQGSLGGKGSIELTTPDRRLRFRDGRDRR